MNESLGELYPLNLGSNVKLYNNDQIIVSK